MRLCVTAQVSLDRASLVAAGGSICSFCRHSKVKSMNLFADSKVCKTRTENNCWCSQQLPKVLWRVLRESALSASAAAINYRGAKCLFSPGCRFSHASKKISLEDKPIKGFRALYMENIRGFRPEAVPAPTRPLELTNCQLMMSTQQKTRYMLSM